MAIVPPSTPDVLVKVKPVELDAMVPASVAVVPYDPLITLKKTVSEAGWSALVLVATALGGWLLDANNIKFLLEHFGVGGTVAMFAVVPLLHGLVKGGLNWLKAHKGVWFERVEPGSEPGQE